MKKTISRFIATAIAITIFSSNIVFASNIDKDELIGIDTDYYLSTNRDLENTKYKITFPDFSEVAEIDEFSLEDQNTKNVTAAILYVESLNLSECGWGYIESACLEELNSYLNNEDILLKSYTVLVPLGTATRASVPSNFAYFGQVDETSTSSRKYYSATVSNTEIDVVKSKVEARGDKLQRWIDGLVNVSMAWANKKVSISYSLVSMIQNMPSRYEVKNTDRMESIFRVNLDNRGIFTENTNGAWGKGDYAMVYTDDEGLAIPYTVTTLSGITPPFTRETDFDAIDVAAAHYNNKQYILSRASNRYHSNDRTPVKESALNDIIKGSLE